MRFVEHLRRQEGRQLGLLLFSLGNKFGRLVPCFLAPVRHAYVAPAFMMIAHLSNR